VGALLTDVFASTEISGPTGSVITQLWGVGTTPIYGFVMTMIILKLLASASVRTSRSKRSAKSRHPAERRKRRMIIGRGK
jgi:ammonia channel protein AmtB